MEPGHEGREEGAVAPAGITISWKPQWSPAMKAGKSDDRADRHPGECGAAMEPGHEGREEATSKGWTVSG